MVKRVGYFKPETSALILEVVQYLVSAGFIPRRGSKRPTTPPPTNITYIYFTPPGGIPGREGNQCFHADCTPYHFDADDRLQPLRNNAGESQQHKIYHIGTRPVEGSVFIQVKRSYGRWLVDFEDCG